MMCKISVAPTRLRLVRFKFELNRTKGTKFGMLQLQMIPQATTTSG